MLRQTMMAVAIAALCAGNAVAAVSAEEAKLLSTTLTPVGAERAGNKEGTIPAWTGGLTTIPAGYQKGSGLRPDPFAADKPRLTITGKDLAAHADKLTAGTQELLKRYPTMRLDVYPTHRPVHFPKRIVDNTLKNATQAKAIEGGVGIENALPGFPFPIPKSGAEAMWNHLMRYNGFAFSVKYDNWNVDSAGVPTLALTAEALAGVPAAGSEEDRRRAAEGRLLEAEAPLSGTGAPRGRGADGLRLRSTRSRSRAVRGSTCRASAASSSRPTSRTTRPIRVRPASRPTTTAFLFNGALDRFDWKLVGKKEMYVPVQQLPVRREPSRPTSPSRTMPIPTWCAGNCIGCGSWKPRSRRASATSTPSAPTISTRTAGSRSRPTTTMRAASSSPPASTS